jgi:hypothetical protein
MTRRRVRRLDDARPGTDWVATLAENGAVEGTRNHSLARLAGYLLGKDVSARAVHALCQAWGAIKCRPAMDPAEITRTVESIVAIELRRRRAEDAR